MTKPRILTLDIETSPHKAYVWKLWDEDVPLARLIESTQMLCWCAKFVGEKPVWRQFRDEDFLSKLREMINAADLIVTYNGAKFDLLHINREFVENGLRPARPCAHIDLLSNVVRNRFKFPSNRLEYVAGAVLGEHKLDTSFGLWPLFMENYEPAVRKMRKYNIQDVRLTEKLYLKLRAWVTNHPHIHAVVPEIDDAGDNYTCRACGAPPWQLVSHRPRFTRCYAIRVLECWNCGHWQDGKRVKL